MRALSSIGGLLRGLGSSASSSLPSCWPAAAASVGAALQWPSTSHVAQTDACVQQQQQQQQPVSHALSTSSCPVVQQQPLRGLGQWSSLHQQLAAQQACHLKPAAAPLLLMQQFQLQLQLQQQQQQHLQQQRWQWPGQQQVRTFVLMPRRTKYRKAHKSMGFNETIVGNTRQLAFGLYGIRALEHCRIPANTLEAVRRTLRRTIKKTTMLWIRVTPNVPVTSKPAEVRMGKGKGTLDYWAAPIRPGQILFEMDRCSKATAQAAVAAIRAKMPIKIEFVEWN